MPPRVFPAESAPCFARRLAGFLRSTALVTALAASAGFWDGASAATVSWLAPASGNWSVGANWSGGSAPGPLDDAVITVAGTYTVTLDTSPTVNSLSLGAATGTQTLFVQNQTLTLTTTASVASGGELLLQGNGSIVGTVDNAGRLVARGTGNSLTTYQSQSGSTLLVEGASGIGDGALTVANGFTNNGLIEITGISVFLGPYEARLTVTNGTLVNVGTINAASQNANQRNNVLAAQLDNRGTMNLTWNLELVKPDADHLNSGSITLGASGEFRVTQSGTDPSFTNQTGATYSIADGRTFLVSGGTFVHDPVVHTGPGGFLTFRNCAVQDVSLTSTSATVVLGDALGGNVSVDSVNSGGTVIARNTGNSITDYASQSGSTLRVDGAADVGNGALTVVNGFTNLGLVELTGIGIFLGPWEARLTVTNGTLTNVGTINAASQNANQRNNVLVAQLDNRGTMNLTWNLELVKPDADHLNSGSISLGPSGEFSVTQSGTTPSFTNLPGATYSIADGRTFLVSGGVFVHDPVVHTGPGGFLSFRNCAVQDVSLTSTSATVVLGDALGGNNTVDSVNSGGTVIARNTGNVITDYTSQSGSTLRVDGAFGIGQGALTVVNGFTNNGLVELTGVQTAFGNQDARLTVTNGTLVNTGIIRGASNNANERFNVLVAEIDNRGTIDVPWRLEVAKPGAAHLNSGSIVLGAANGQFTVTQTGTTPSFTNLPGATYTIPTDRVFLVSGGAFVHDPVVHTGPSGFLTFRNCAVQNVSLTSTSATVVLGDALGGNNTVNSVNSAAGTVIARHIGNVITDYACQVGSTLQVDGAGDVGHGALTVVNGFTNYGLVELTGIGIFLGPWEARLTVTNGTLTNVGTFRSTSRNQNPRTNYLTARFDNQGLTEIQWLLVCLGGPVFNAPSGTVRGGHTLDVSAVTYVDDGTTLPGTSPGILTIQQNDTRGATSALHVEIGGYAPGPHHDQLFVPGTVTVNGTLGISLINGFLPVRGDRFVVVLAAARVDTFTTLSGLAINDTLAWRVIYESDRVVLQADSLPPNAKPVAGDDQAQTGEDQLIDIPVLANDTDADAGDTLRVVASGFSAPYHGIVALNPDQTVRYTPDGDFFGADSFQYVVSDNRPGGLDTATVVVTITPINDPPTFTSPLATNDTTHVTMGFEKKISVDVIATDVDTHPGSIVTLTVTGSGLPGDASLSPPLPRSGRPVSTHFTWTPDRTWMGHYYVEFTAEDDSGATHVIILHIEVVDNPTPTLLAQFTATPAAGGVELRWRFAGDIADVVIERRTDRATLWERVDAERRDEAGAVVALDRTARADVGYTYRLRGTSGEIFGSIHVPGAPLVLALSPVAPSPTRGAARIGYTLPRAGDVRLSLCDVMGREVAVLESGARAAGRHEVAWTGRIGEKQPAAGVYFVRLETLGQRLTQRMVVAP